MHNKMYDFRRKSLISNLFRQRSLSASKNKGISPIISMVMLIIIVFAIAGTVGPWLVDIARTASEKTGSDVSSGLACSKFSYAFDADYGTNGVEHDFSGASDWLKAEITNTGSINAYNLSFELLLETDIREYSLTKRSEKTEASPLKPGQSAVLEANITDNLAAGSLREVKVLNEACPGFFISTRV